MAKAVASIGLMGLLTAIVTYQVGTEVIKVNPIFPQNHLSFLGVNIAEDRLLLAATIIGLGIVLTVLFRFTRFGLATRASAETEVGALVSGLSPDRVALINWIISFVVCGIAGILIAPLVPLVPGTYTLFIVPALAAAVVGRFHSLGWAITTGLGIGALESLSVYLNGIHPGFPAGAGELIPLVLVLVVLAVRGQTMPSRGTLLQVTLGRAPRPHWRLPTAVVATAVGIGAIYLFTGNDRAALYTSMITGVITLSLVVVTGYTGQISLAQLTFAGVSAYILSTFANSWGIPFPIAPIMASLVAAAAGVVIGIPALRVRGLMLGVVTLTFAAGVEAIWFDNNSLDGGAGGLAIPTPRLFGMDLGIGSGKDFPRPAFGILCLVVLVLVALGVSWLRTSRLGSAMLAVRADERSAAAAGINVVRVKLIAFADRGLHRRVGRVAARLSAGKRDLPGLRRLSRTRHVLHRGRGRHHLGQRRHPGRDHHLRRPPGDADLLGRRPGRRRQLVRGRRRHRRHPHGDLQPRRHRGADPPLPGAAEVARRHGATRGCARAVDADGVAGAGLRVHSGSRAGGDVGRSRRLQPSAENCRRRPARRSRRSRPRQASWSGVAQASGPTATRWRRETEGWTAARREGPDRALRRRGRGQRREPRVEEGQIVGLIGPNGAGKTTMIDALCGFQPYAGSVVLAGKSVEGYSPHRRAALGLARTFQLAGVADDLTVEENVQVGQHMAVPTTRRT